MKAKVLSIVALLLMAVVGATAQTTHTVTVMEGTKDAAKWSADPNPAQQDQTVTVTYSGTKKVKGIKAVNRGVAGKVADIKLTYAMMTLIPD